MLETLVVHDQHNQIHASTTICSPQLPPPTETNAGALQPASVRQVATPRPCLPPKMKPPLIKFGTTRMHFASLNTSSGMPLSGVAVDRVQDIDGRLQSSICIFTSRAGPRTSSNQAYEPHQQH